MRLILLLLGISLLSACADSHQLTRTGRDVNKLDRDTVVYISISQDGRYGQTIYRGSGQNTTQILAMAFSQFSKRVETAQRHQAFEAALGSARKHNAGYLVMPTILQWEDRATEWSGRPDSVSVKISIIDPTSGKQIDSAIINGKSGLMTFGGDHPQDLLPKPMTEYVKSLF